MDDLKKIKGVGPARAKKLNEVGITSYDDILNLTDARVAELDEALELRGAFDRDDWKAEARRLKDEGSETSEGDDQGDEDGDETDTTQGGDQNEAPNPLKPSEGAKDESFTEDSGDPDNAKQNTSSEPFGGADVPTSLEDPEAKAHYGAGAPVPRGAVAAGGNHEYSAPGAPYTPDRPTSPDEDVERALMEAQNDAKAGNDKRAKLNESKNYGEVVGTVEGYSEAVRYEQGGKMFNAQKLEVKRST